MVGICLEGQSGFFRGVCQHDYMPINNVIPHLSPSLRSLEMINKNLYLKSRWVSIINIRLKYKLVNTLTVTATLSWEMQQYLMQFPSNAHFLTLFIFLWTQRSYPRPFSTMVSLVLMVSSICLNWNFMEISTSSQRTSIVPLWPGTLLSSSSMSALAGTASGTVFFSLTVTTSRCYDCVVTTMKVLVTSSFKSKSLVQAQPTSHPQLSRGL